MKLQGAEVQDHEALQSQIGKIAENRLPLSGLEIFHGRLSRDFQAAQIDPGVLDREFLLHDTPQLRRLVGPLTSLFSFVILRAAKRRGDTRIGMTGKQVEATCWGKPDHVNRTQTAVDISDQYVYGDGRYVYLQNGIVTVALT